MGGAGTTLRGGGRSRAFSRSSRVTRDPSHASSAHGGRDRAFTCQDRALSVVSFGEKRHVLRASRSSSVMRCFANILTNSSGSADTYALSASVEDIDDFISHNWIVSRFKKFLCLVLYFNFYPACLVGIITLAGMLIFKPPTGGYEPVIVPVVFTVVLLSWHEIQMCVCRVRPGRSVFLDKTCIHQVDTHLMAEGIGKLGAFIGYSSRMVSVYTDVYLKKLWTVYEVACFLALHTTDELTIIPTFAPILFFSLFIIATIANNLVGEDMGTLAAIARTIINVLVALPIVTSLRYSAYIKDAIHKTLEAFQVDECTCFNEDDREFVYDNIAVLMRSIGEVGEDAEQEAALEAFNQLVRHKLPGCMTASIGAVGLRYVQVAAIFSISNAGWNMGGSFKSGQLLNALLQGFGVFPFLMGMLSIWLGCCLHLNWLFEVIYDFLGLLVVLFLTMPLLQAGRTASEAWGQAWDRSSNTTAYDILGIDLDSTGAAAVWVGVFIPCVLLAKVLLDGRMLPRTLSAVTVPVEERHQRTAELTANASFLNPPGKDRQMGA